MNRRRILRLGLGATALFLPVPHAFVWAQSEGATKLVRAPKQALVIGNAAYRNVSPLRNPANDAKAIAGALSECGFKVATLVDASREDLVAAIDRHAKSLASEKAVGLFYFAGHGVQLAWRNYLVPVDARVRAQVDIPMQAIDLAMLIDGVAKAANPMNVIILDACRDNPFGDFRVEQKGLSQMDAPPQTLLAYATAPGNVAADGEGSNGLYTESLLREMKTRDAKIEDVFKRARLAVRRASKGRQVPWESTSLEDDFYFFPPESLKRLSREEDQKRFAAELALFQRARDGRDATLLTEYLGRYPSGRFAELAQLELDRVLAAQGEKPVEPAPAAGNPYTVGTARADTQFRIGDTYSYQVNNLKSGGGRRIKNVVTEITASEVVFNDGALICDHLGNIVKRPNGQRYGPNQQIPLDYAVGKRWTTRYDVIGGGEGTVTMDYRIAAREKLTLPAGTFDAFRIEGHGWNESAFRSATEIEFTFWRAPERVRMWLGYVHRVSGTGGVIESTRSELVDFRQL